VKVRRRGEGEKKFKRDFPSVTGEGFLADHQFITAFWGCAARVMSALNLMGTRDKDGR
jgi:hypothetical protein